MLPPQALLDAIPKGLTQQYPAEKYSMEYLGPCISNTTGEPSGLFDALDSSFFFHRAATRLGDLDIEIHRGSLKKGTYLWKIEQGRIGADRINWATNQWKISFHTEGKEETIEVCRRMGIDPEGLWGADESSSSL